MTDYWVSLSVRDCWQSSKLSSLTNQHSSVHLFYHMREYFFRCIPKLKMWTARLIQFCTYKYMYFRIKATLQRKTAVFIIILMRNRKTQRTRSLHTTMPSTNKTNHVLFWIAIICISTNCSQRIARPEVFYIGCINMLGFSYFMNIPFYF